MESVELPATVFPTSLSILGKQMVAGGLAGAIADGATYPMMTIKSRMQVQGAQTSYSYSGPLHAATSIIAKEGWRSLYKGFTTVVQTAPAQALYMGSYQAWRAAVPLEDSLAVEFFGGIVATLGQSVLMVPLEVVRQRQQVQVGGRDGAYKGSLDAARAIYRAEGVGAFYRGFGMTQMVWAPFNAVFLPLWETGKRAAANYSGVSSVKDLDVRYQLLSSFVSSAIAAAISNPMDVAKTRLQVQGKSNVASATHYTGAIDAIRTLARKEGLIGFTRGTTSRVLWVAPSTMIMFTLYDQIMRVLD